VRVNSLSNHLDLETQRYLNLEMIFAAFNSYTTGIYIKGDELVQTKKSKADEAEQTPKYGRTSVPRSKESSEQEGK
jgi:hypothetical protein